MKKLITFILAAILCPFYVYADSNTNEYLYTENLTTKNTVLDIFSPYFISVDGILFSNDKKTLISYPKDRSDEYYSIPEGTEYIAADAFSQNHFLTRLLIPSSLKQIGANPFSGCKFLKTIIISPQNKNFIFDDGALYNREKTILYFCIENIPEFTVPESVTTISYEAFSHCDTLKKIVLPQNLSVIESMAFCGCSSLAEIFLPDKLENINPSCFFGCSSLKNINADNSYFKSSDGILYTSDMIDLVVCPPGKGGIISIPEGVKNVLNGAFDGCSKITSVHFPESLENVSRAFSNCTSLKNIELPPTQAIIEYGTFSGCDSLDWIYLPNNIVIIQDKSLPDNVLIACDEGSFAEYFAEENSHIFQYKFNLYSDGKKLFTDSLIFENHGTVYLPLNDTCEALGGTISSDTYISGISLIKTIKLQCFYDVIISTIFPRFLCPH